MPFEPHRAAPSDPAPASRGWLQLVLARQTLDRCTALLGEWRELRAARRAGLGQRSKRWRRLASAAAGLLLVFGGMMRGLWLSGSTDAATIPFFVGRTIDGAFDDAQSVSYADLDGDGDLDALGAATSPYDVTWWENDGTPADGGWITHTIDAAFVGATSVTAADLDGDGDLDVLAVGSGVHLAWWENDGSPANGGWTTHTIANAYLGGQTVAAADLDGDGDLDVLAAMFNPTDDVTWWENDGSPANGGWVTHTIDGGVAGALGVAAADLDGDGDLDVLGTSYYGDQVIWWENDGTPANGGWVTHTIDAAFDGAQAVTYGDLDRDGDLDVLGAAIYADDITWWENDGSPANGGWVTHTIDAAFDGAASVAAADLDMDGDLDVLGTASDADDVAWWENDGTPQDGGWITHTIDAAFDGAYSAVAADLDGDGDLDVLAAAAFAQDITWWENRTIHRNALLGGTIPFTHTISGAVNGPYSTASADLDGDGDLDVLAAASAGMLWWESDGTPADGGWTTHTIDGAFTGAESVAVADLDRDGDLDVLGASFLADDITWWENDGTPFDGGWTTHTISGAFDAAWSAAAADVDGDGDLDVLGAAIIDDDITWWENDGTPQNGGWVTHTIDAAFDGAADVAAADLDGDGDLDVLGAAAVADDITWWENDGTPLNGGWITHTIDGAFDATHDLAAADLDGDGDVDVLGTARSADGVAWWANDGTPLDGGWTTHTISGAFDGARSVTAADLDGDGDLDVLGAAYTGDDIAWWASDGTPGDGGWTTHTISGAFDGGYAVAAADLDGDGDLDALGAAAIADDVTWWSNHGGQFTLPTTGTAPVMMSPSGSDDFLKIAFTHNGRSGDNDEELVTLHLRFEDTTGAPDALTTSEANAIIAALRVYRDDGSGLFESGSDTLVTSVSPLALDGSGDQIVTFADGDAEVQLPHATGTRTYFVVLDLTAGYSTDPNRNGVTRIRVTHITQASSTAEDRPNDLPLEMAFTANTQSSTAGTELEIVTPTDTPTPTNTPTPTDTPTPTNTPTPTDTPTPTNTPTPDAPTSVELRAFRIEPWGDRVALVWETASEADVVGFNVYRATAPDEPGSRVNPALIPATGGAAAGARYALRDLPPAVGTYFYRLEVVNREGVPERHGPMTLRWTGPRLFLPWLGQSPVR